MRTLELVLKKHWFDMIVSGEKKEEYREITSYWAKRFLSQKIMLNPFFFVRFRHGYAKDAPETVLHCLDISITEGRPEWGAKPGVKYFVIKLGDFISADAYSFIQA